MPTNVIPDGEAFVFGPLRLHGALQRIDATDEQDVAEHRILKRDGAILEGMGWKSNRYEAVCVFVGDSFRGDVLRMRNQIRRKSQDVLVHPLYGSLTARCTRIVGALNIPAEANAATITLSFIQAGIDPNQIAQAGQTVAAKSQALSSSVGDMITLASFYSSTAAAGAVGSLATEGYAYAAAALDVLQSGTPDPSLGLQIVTIESQALASIAAIQADPFSTTDVDRFDALASCDLVYAAALDLQDAVNQVRPQVVPYIVPAPCSYLSLLNSLYGSSALDREGEFATYNPDILDPSYIPAGTVVYVSAPPPAPGP